MRYDSIPHMLQMLGLKNLPDSSSINPLEVAIDYEFAIHVKGDYRERAIDRCIYARIDFVSEQNSLSNLAKRCVKVVCPICGVSGQLVTSSASSNSHTLHFNCSCGVEVCLNMPSDGIGIKFPHAHAEL